MPSRFSFPRRGSIYLVQFDPSFGHEVRKERPAVVISSDHLNALAATVLVMPITSGRYSYYHWITLAPPEGGLRKVSSIVTEQIRAVDKRRLQKRLGAVRPRTMTKIEEAIRDHCGLPEGRVLPLS
ncbi:MAG: growth inhibitor protein [Candidatus Peregrinibacteria bacterium Greene0416_19]|nr:MAG: growth inhibitor protein [Candidatus Peregrinibacteria bacterium Greene0416_19]